MFQENKYITCGVEEHVPVTIQLMLWHMIELARNRVELDYLQVFNISKDNNTGLVHITHHQEQPEYKNEVFVLCDDEVDSHKVFVIDDVTHCTMLLAEEY